MQRTMVKFGDRQGNTTLIRPTSVVGIETGSDGCCWLLLNTGKSSEVKCSSLEAAKKLGIKVT